MAGGLERFVQAAQAAGIDPEVRRFPEGTKTAQDAARAIGCDVAQIVKSLVFVADGQPVLALTSGRHRVDTAVLGALCGSEVVRRATPEEARSATGFAVGGTPPFGHPAPVRTFVDETLLSFETVWAAAGTPDSVFPLASTELVRLCGGTVAVFHGSPPQG
ncbi:MAG: YbaK/EbsC family protein [Planctomycetaceae bacterium]